MWMPQVAQWVKNPPAMHETQEIKVPSMSWEEKFLFPLPLEKEMASHSSIFAWRTPWTEEPGGLHSPWGHKRLRSWYRWGSLVSSVTQSYPTLCDPMNRSMPGLPVHHQLPQFTQTHVHQVSDAIQPSHPLSSPSPPAFHLSKHQGLFQ